MQPGVDEPPVSEQLPAILDIFRAAVARAPDGAALHYLDSSLTYRTVDALSDALAARLIDRGFETGDRLALFLQNTPHFVIGMLAAWKAGGICVPINPMNKEREVALILEDCTPSALICLDGLFDDVIARLDPAIMPAITMQVSPLEFQVRPYYRLFGEAQILDRPGLVRFAQLAEAGLSPTYRSAAPGAEDPAMLVYTSGTTGKPKGAIISHGAFGFNAGAFCKVAELSDGDAILGIAPLFHITGSVACLGAAITIAAPLILTFRFDPIVVLDAIDRWQPRFVVAAITAFIALFNHEQATRERLAGLRKVFSGGAPVPPPFVDEFEAKFGHYIHNCYGLTETASATHITPLGARAPIGGDSVLSIGKPAPGAVAHVVDETGARLPPGEIGELVILGPMVSAGYWRNPDESAINMRPDGFRTGDIAFYDAQGWFYLVDRKKDVIISSGYKVWPREVEDVLYTHPAIREAAVIGVADPYRGETVKAVVSLKPGTLVDTDTLLAFSKARLAIYKYPRIIEIIDELPKTTTGKILRRALRE